MGAILRSGPFRGWTHESWGCPPEGRSPSSDVGILDGDSAHGTQRRTETVQIGREACAADAVIVGSGMGTREVTEDPAIMNILRGLDPSRQLIAAQCSGALVLARLGLLNDIPVCTDLTSKPWVVAAGVEVLDQPFYAEDNIATAGGCLASHYLAAWVIARLAGHDAAEGALHYVAPVGEKEEYVERAWRNITCYLPASAPALV